MPDLEKTFVVGEDKYTIPAKESSEFLKEFKNAIEVISFKKGNDIFDVPVDNVPNYLSKHKDVVPESDNNFHVNFYKSLIPKQTNELSKPLVNATIPPLPAGKPFDPRSQELQTTPLPEPTPEGKLQTEINVDNEKIKDAEVNPYGGAFFMFEETKNLLQDKQDKENKLKELNVNKEADALYPMVKGLLDQTNIKNLHELPDNNVNEIKRTLRDNGYSDKAVDIVAAKVMSDYKNEFERNSTNKGIANTQALYPDKSFQFAKLMYVEKAKNDGINLFIGDDKQKAIKLKKIEQLSSSESPDDKTERNKLIEEVKSSIQFYDPATGKRNNDPNKQKELQGKSDVIAKEMSQSFQGELKDLYLDKYSAFKQSNERLNAYTDAFNKRMGDFQGYAYSPAMSVSKGSILAGDDKYNKLVDLVQNTQLQYVAASKLYLLNQDPSEIKVNPISVFFASAVNSLVGTKVYETNRDVLDITKEIFEGKDWKPTEKQTDKFEQGIFEMTAGTTGSIVGILPSLMVMNEAAEATGITKLTGSLIANGTFKQKVLGHVLNMMVEGAKFKGIGSSFSSGAGFALGANVRLPLPFNAKWNGIISPIWNKLIYGSVGATILMNVGNITEMLSDKIFEDRDFQYLMDLAYPNQKEVGKKLLSEFIANTLFGATHIKSIDFKTKPESLVKYANEKETTGDYHLSAMALDKAVAIKHNTNYSELFKEKPEATANDFYKVIGNGKKLYPEMASAIDNILMSNNPDKGNGIVNILSTTKSEQELGNALHYIRNRIAVEALKGNNTIDPSITKDLLDVKPHIDKISHNDGTVKTFTDNHGVEKQILSTDDASGTMIVYNNETKQTEQEGLTKYPDLNQRTVTLGKGESEALLMKQVVDSWNNNDMQSQANLKNLLGEGEQPIPEAKPETQSGFPPPPTDLTNDGNGNLSKYTPVEDNSLTPETATFGRKVILPDGTTGTLGAYDELSGIVIVDSYDANEMPLQAEYPLSEIKPYNEAIQTPANGDAVQTETPQSEQTPTVNAENTETTPQNKEISIGNDKFSVITNPDGSSFIPFADGKDKTKVLKAKINPDKFDIIPVTEEVIVPSGVDFIDDEVKTVLKGVNIVPKAPVVEVSTPVVPLTNEANKNESVDNVEEKPTENKIQSWIDAWEAVKEKNDPAELDMFYNKVKVALNGYAQGKDVVPEFEALKSDIETYAEQWKNNNSQSIINQNPNQDGTKTEGKTEGQGLLNKTDQNPPVVEKPTSDNIPSNNNEGDVVSHELSPEELAALDEELKKAELEAATHPNNNIPHPTDAQKEEGNYKMGHIKIQGLDLTIENPKGSIRSGVDHDGEKWQVEMNHTYGYIKKTKGKDKDHVDCFVGDNLNSDKVYVINQIDPKTGEFDEHKVMIGFNSAREAGEAYLSNYAPGWGGLGSMREMSIDKFKKWVYDKNKTIKPVPKERKVRTKEEIEAEKAKKEEKAVLLMMQPESLREATLHFFAAGGRVKTINFLKHFQQADMKYYIWAVSNTDSGIFTDLLNEQKLFSNFVTEENDGQNEFFDVLRGIKSINEALTQLKQSIEERGKIGNINDNFSFTDEQIQDQIEAGNRQIEIEYADFYDEYFESLENEREASNKIIHEYHPQLSEKELNILYDEYRRITQQQGENEQTGVYQPNDESQQTDITGDRKGPTAGIKGTDGGNQTENEVKGKLPDEVIDEIPIEEKDNAQIFINSILDTEQHYPLSDIQKGQIEKINQEFTQGLNDLAVKEINLNKQLQTELNKINQRNGFFGDLSNEKKDIDVEADIVVDNDTVNKVLDPIKAKIRAIPSEQQAVFDKAKADVRNVLTQVDLFTGEPEAVKPKEVFAGDVLNEITKPKETPVKYKIEGTEKQSLIISVGDKKFSINKFGVVAEIKNNGVKDILSKITGSSIDDANLVSKIAKENNVSFSIDEKHDKVYKWEDVVKPINVSKKVDATVLALSLADALKKTFADAKERHDKAISLENEYFGLNNITAEDYDKLNDAEKATKKESGIQTQLNWDEDVPFKRNKSFDSTPTGRNVQRENNYKPDHDSGITFAEIELRNKGKLEFVDDTITGPAKIKSADDIAFLFKNLEESAVENAFAVFIDKNNKYKVFYISTGTTEGVTVDLKLITAAAKEFGAKKICFIHNHPSGTLAPSSADVVLSKRLKEAVTLAGYEYLDPVIIDKDRGEFSTFSSDIDYDITKTGNHNKEGIQEYDVYKFDKQKLYKPTSELAKVSSSMEAAVFLSMQKRGIVNKIHVIILNKANNITRYYLEDGNISTNNLIKNLLNTVGKYGCSVILSSNSYLQNTDRIQKALSLITVKLLDVIEVKQEDDIIHNYRSYADSRTLNKPVSDYITKINDSGVSFKKESAISFNKPTYETAADVLYNIGQYETHYNNIKNAVDNFSNEFGVKVQVVRTRLNLPNYVQKQMDKGRYQGAYDQNTGIVYVVAHETNNVEEAIATACHEIIGHKGLRGLLGNEFEPMMKLVYDSMTKEQREAILKLYPNFKPEDHINIADEFTARMAEKDAVPSWFGKIIAKIREFLRNKLGFDIKMSDKDLIYLLWKSKNKLREDVSAGEVMDNIVTGDKVIKNAASFKRVDPTNPDIGFKAVDSKIDEFRKKVQDKTLPIKLMQEELTKKSGVKLTGLNNVWEAENKYKAGATKQFIYFQREQMNPLMDAVRDIVKEHKKTDTEISDYLLAKASIELQDLGEITAFSEDVNDKWNRDLCEKIVEDFENSVDKTLIDNLWSKVNDATHFSLGYMYKSGFIKEDDYKAMLAKRKFYVPLRGWNFEGETNPLDYFNFVSNGNDGSFDNPVIKAKGRTSKPENPLPHIAMMGESAIIYGMKNKYKQTVLNLMQQHIDRKDVAELKKSWQVLNPNTGEWEVSYDPPKDLLDERKSLLKEIDDLYDTRYIAGTKQLRPLAERQVIAQQIQALQDKIQVKPQTNRTHQQKTPSWVDDVRTVEIWKHGEKYQIVFKDPEIANAINGDSNLGKKTQAVSQAANVVLGKATRFLSANFTALNPDFLLPNFLRDFAFANAAHWINNEGMIANFNKNIPKASAAIHRFIRDTQDFTNNADKQMRDFLVRGGATGYTQLKDYDRQMRDINDELFGKKGFRKLTGDAALYTGMHHAGKLIDYLAQQSELTSRFATYLAAIDSGKSADEAVTMAKNVTVNFDRKGELSTLLGSMYAFFNAGVQGADITLQMFQKRPKRMLAACLSFVAMGLLNSALLTLMRDPDDKDYPTDWEIGNNICVSTSGGWIKIPLPHFFRSLWGIGAMMSRVYNNETEANKAAYNVIDGLVNAFSPMNFMSGMSEATEGKVPLRPIVPTALIPGYDLLVNADFKNDPVYREMFTKSVEGYTPNSEKGMKNTNAALYKTTKWFNELGGGNEFLPAGVDPTGREDKNILTYMKRALDWNPAKIEHVAEYALGGRGKFWNNSFKTIYNSISGKELNPYNIPIANRFYTTQREQKNIYPEYKEVTGHIKDYEHYLSQSKSNITEKDKQAYPFMKLVTDVDMQILKVKRDILNKRIDLINEQLDRTKDETIIKEKKKAKYKLMQELIDEYNKRIKKE